MTSKVKSNKLLPYQLYDYLIKLKKNTLTSNLKFYLLYYILAKELKVVKKYLVKNLDKGFIKPSQALFMALVLFIKKLDRSLYFYIDYKKLNLLIKKDQYLLPLINKTLA